MNDTKSSFSLAPRHQGYIALALWGFACLLLLRRDVFAVDEAAVRGLLLSWSIADQLATSVITHGLPDFRVLVLLPVGYLWTNNVFAAKVLSAALIALSAWILYGWRNRTAGSESALFSTGLLLVAPITLSQIDSISTGVYLLATIAIATWLDTRYRANPRPFNGWFFSLIFVCAFAVSLHPAGLAVPLALGFAWRTLPQTLKFQRFFLGGVIFSTILIFGLMLSYGWDYLTWFQNPIRSLSAPFAAGYIDEGVSAWQWLPGTLLIVLAVLVALTQFRALWASLTGRMLLFSFLFGVTVGDQAWGLIALSLLLYGGMPVLLGSQQVPGASNFPKYRGLALAVVIVCTTVFMLADKAHYAANRNGVISHQDELIKTLAIAAEEEHQAAREDEGVKHHARFIVASQWPSRTMLACKCDTLPLPPAAATPEQQLKDLKTVTHLIFNPKQTSNLDLVRNFSSLGAQVETVSLQPGGVMLHVRETEASPAPEKKGKS